MHNDDNSTYFSHFWSNIKRNKWQNKCTPTLFSQKSRAHIDTAAFSCRTTTQCTTNAKKICCTITRITQMQHCPTTRSKVDDIRIQRHNMLAVTDRQHSTRDHLSTLYRSWRSLADPTWRVTIAARHTHFQSRNGIFTIKTPLLHICARKFWYFPVLKHDIIPTKYKQTGVFTLNFIVSHQKVTNSICQVITLKTCITKVILPIHINIIYVHSRLRWHS